MKKVIEYRNIHKLSKLQLHQLIIHLNSEISKCTRKLKEYQEDYHYSQLESLKTENNKLLDELKNIQSQLEKQNNQQAHREDYEKQIQALKHERNQLKQDWMKMIRLYQKQKRKIDALEKGIQKQMKNDEVLEEINQYWKEKMEKKIGMEEMQWHIYALESQHSQQEQTLNRTKDEAVRLKVENEIYKRKNRELQKACRLLKQEAKEVDQHYDQIKEKNIQLEKQVFDLENTIHQLKEDNNKYKQEIEEFHCSKVRLQETMDKYLKGFNFEQYSSAFNFRNDPHFVKQLERLMKSVHVYDSRLSSSIKVIQQLEMQIDQLKKEIRNIRNQLSS
ncbi:hypothetical protein [Bacillus sp. FJAT-47783]|uniref:hypothetical protein n=1 Tax=Bacillus sp. FJAT-47783 TaxID=2922712 RepID=UPI001FADBA9D|nr:hypothetical protein [Bacillus sp. FJAT-47783]